MYLMKTLFSAYGDRTSQPIDDAGRPSSYLRQMGIKPSLFSSHRQNKYGRFRLQKRANREVAGYLPAKQNQCLPMTVNCTDAEWESVPLFPTTAKV